MQPIIETKILYSRQEIVSRDSNVVIPNEPGVCAFYFKEIPGITPADDCNEKFGRTLLFISKTANLRGRIKSQHLKGKVEQSVLRVGLAALLYQEGKLHHSIYKKDGKEILHSDGEAWLNSWMDENAFVCWQPHNAPNAIKVEILADWSVPLNTKDNKHHPFSKHLRRIKAEVRNSP